MSSRRARIKAQVSIPAKKRGRDVTREDTSKALPTVQEKEEEAPSPKKPTPLIAVTPVASLITLPPPVPSTPSPRPEPVSDIEGIKPIKPASKPPAEEDIPKSLSAECSFDPIIPLPSDAEADKRQTPKRPPSGRFRNDSVCSLPADHPLQTPRQKTKWRSGMGDCIRRTIARKRALSGGPQLPLTMCDLIYYNPPKSQSKTSDVKKEEKIFNSVKVKTPPITVQEIPENVPTKNEDSNSMPVPRVKLGPNGEIVIDEQSLVIETTDAIKSRTELPKLSLVYENGQGSNSSGSYRKISRPRDWTDAETIRFYKVLNTLGTDFGLMLPLFPGRTRRDLKIKFKKEEKQNSKLIDKALMNPVIFDMTELEEDLNVTKEVENEKKKEPSKPINYRKTSMASRSFDVTSEKSFKPATSKRREDETKLPAKSENPQMDSEDIEPGSLIISVNKNPKKPGINWLQAYVAQVVDGEKKILPVQLESEKLMNLARDMNILRPGENYEIKKTTEKS